MTKEKTGIIVGGGIGGLVAAIRLAARGYKITLLEKNSALGGKLQNHSYGPYTFDFGPSTITMPWVFERIFEESGESLDPDLQFIKLDVNSRNFFPDGSVIDLSSDPERMSDQLQVFSRANREGFMNYLTEVERIYTTARQHFFSRTFTRWSDFLSPALGIAMLGVHPFTTMDGFHRRYFDDPRMLAMMNRYATYVGSSPYKTPATLAMIAYLELVRGVYYIRGGNYKLIQALERLARKKGVDIKTNTSIQRIIVHNGKAAGVQAEEEVWHADFVISNNDYFSTQLYLLDQENRSLPAGRMPGTGRRALSSSGFLMLLGVRTRFPQLQHHNLFFPDRYESEAADIFSNKIWPRDPALYICNSAYTEPGRARDGSGSNLYVLANVPACAPGTDGYGAENLHSMASQYGQQITAMLEKRGLTGLSGQTEVEQLFHPGDIANLSGSVYGALYGQASHGLKSAFFRPSIADRRVQGLYYAGGTTHPGGGTPMVALSGILAAEAVALADGGADPLTSDRTNRRNRSECRPG
ncbi:NAD(P)/FAD-dependent oxidoreductase [Paenibacillus sp. FJAT-26967]|uniref:phytoene desaturase family protein n=1 Tax=Paenibacillus sp. FJAT-26967 TaxID=1729690 RepID=UPI0009FFC319|nr:phytoene desaturase family protein [Paenibacillus sp. FJAT-26967]